MDVQIITLIKCCNINYANLALRNEYLRVTKPLLNKFTSNTSRYNLHSF